MAASYRRKGAIAAPDLGLVITTEVSLGSDEWSVKASLPTKQACNVTVATDARPRNEPSDCDEIAALLPYYRRQCRARSSQARSRPQRGHPGGVSQPL